MVQGISIMFFSIMFLISCSKEDLPDGQKQPTAEWTILSKEKNIGVNTVTENNNLIYAYNSTNHNRKLSVKFGALPTTPTMLKVVDYFKVPLAADEMIIGILDEDFFYLSTGTDSLTISPQITTNTVGGNIENIIIRFVNVRVGRNDKNFNLLDATTVSGFISQQ